MLIPITTTRLLDAIGMRQFEWGNRPGSSASIEKELSMDG
jgi:hypothetical protein